MSSFHSYRDSRGQQVKLGHRVRLARTLVIDQIENVIDIMDEFFLRALIPSLSDCL
jgi:hypothetical protein